MTEENGSFLTATMETPAIQPTPEPVPVVETPATPEVLPTDVKKGADLIKLERRLAKKQAEAQAVIDNANQYREAFNEPDLVQALTKLGLKPDDVYKKMTEHALNQINKKPLDPKEAELLETKRELAEYKDQQDKLVASINQEREIAFHNKAMNDRVAPVFNAAPQDYEVLIATFGSKEAAIANVYQECYNHFCKTKEIYDPKEAADAMEEYYVNEYKSSISNAKKLSKFKEYFKDDPAVQTDTAGVPGSHAANETLQSDAEQFSKALSAKQDIPLPLDSPKQSTTLSNNLGSSSSKPGKRVVKDHLKEFMKAHNIT